MTKRPTSYRLSNEAKRQLSELAKHYGESVTDTITRLAAERHVSIFGEVGEMNINYFRLSDLTEIKKEHLAWRLDNKTGCGVLTAAAVARGDHGDLSLVEIFQKYGDCSPKAAAYQAGKVMRFRLSK